MEDLADLPTVRFTQKRMSIYTIQRTLSTPARAPQMFNVTDRATLNGILERTDAYATGSGF